MLSAGLETHQSFVLSKHKTHDVFEKNKYIKIINVLFKKSYIVQKGSPLGDKTLETKEKKKTEIKREKRLVQPKFCKLKEALDCREFLKTISKRIYVREGRF